MATKQETDETSGISGSGSTAPTAVIGDTVGTSDGPVVVWAPAEPAPAKRRLWLWIGVPTLLVAGGAVAASLVLIAPGTSVAGVPVGFLTAGAATDAIEQRLAETSITLGGDGGPDLTGADLGASVDAGALAASAFDERPMWNLGQWFGDPVDATITLDADKAADSLRAALPDAYVDPTPATVSFADGGGYSVVPAVDGSGVDLDAVGTALQDAFTTAATGEVVDAEPVAVPAAATTEAAQAAADNANAMLAAIGFYVGDERTVPVDPATAASWLTIQSDSAGVFTVQADAAKIQAVVDTLQPLVDRAPANGTVITNSDGTVLETTVAGQDGRVLGETSGVADAFAAQLASGDAVYRLPVEVTTATVTTLERLLEVDLSGQHLYLKENGVVVDSWPISSGVAASPTDTGHYRINSHISSQTMSSSDPDDPYWNYTVENVQWVMYFNGDQAFHGVYWHNNFGTTPQSHGCVGMPNWRAKQIYDWAPTGVDVWIHD